MISFIIIGRNEGWKITLCLESVFKVIEGNNFQDAEVIYVDSKSTDDSIERVQAFENVKIYQIIGKCNAAVARNIGAKEANGDVLCFIDGDMEIQSGFFQTIFDENRKLNYPFVSGGLINYNYDSNWNLLGKEEYGRNTNKDRFENTTGGIFIIEKKLWDSVKGMRTKFMRNQDIDLGLRLSKSGYPILRKKEIIAFHHTIPYGNKNRTWKMLFNGSELYPMVLYRDHFFYLPAQKLFIFGNYTLILLFFFLFISLLFGVFYQFVIYLLFLLYKAFNVSRKVNFIFFNSLIKYFFRDIMRFFAFLFFYPKEIHLDYMEISNNNFQKDI